MNRVFEEKELGELNVVVVKKDTEKYIFTFQDGDAVQALMVTGNYAANPDLSFSWFDAACVCKRIREVAKA